MPLVSTFSALAARALGLTNGAPPGAPIITNIAVTSVQISFNITPVLGSFTIARFERQLGSGEWVDIGNVSSYAITGLTSSTSYTFGVRAVDVTGQISDITINTATTDPEIPPNPPSSVTLTQKATTTDGKNALKLDLLYGVATQGTLPIQSYQYRITLTSNSSVVIDWTTLTTPPAQTFVVTGLQPGTQYTAAVRAVSTSGTPGNATTASATTAAVKANSAPVINFVSENRNASQTAASITFNYGVSSGGTYDVAGYRWQLHTASEIPATVGPGVNATTVEYPASTTVTIKVRSVDTTGAYSDYGTYTRTITNATPGQPFLSFTSTQTYVTQIGLSWVSGGNTTSYKVYQDGSEVTSTSSTTYTATNLTPGQTYSFQVIPYNGTVVGSGSNTKTIQMGSKDQGGQLLKSGPFYFAQNSVAGCSNAGTTWSHSLPGITDDNRVGYQRALSITFRLEPVAAAIITCPTSGTRTFNLSSPNNSKSIGQCFGAGNTYGENMGNATSGSIQLISGGSGWTSVSSSCSLNTPNATMVGRDFTVNIVQTTQNQVLQ